jgi:hypothetical protein
MSIEFLPPDDDPPQRTFSLEEYAARNILTSTMSGGPIYGAHWPPNPQAFGSSLGLANLGTLAQQALTKALLAQLPNKQAQFLTPTQLAYAQQCAYTPPEPEPIEDAGISAGEIIGHRAWRVHNGLLQSMAVDTVWAPNEVMEGIPDNGLGVHAFKTASAVLTEYGCHGPVAIGTVLLWGEVIEHELGYRAEFGKVNSIDLLTKGLSQYAMRHRKKWWRRETYEESEQRRLYSLRRLYGV